MTFTKRTGALVLSAMALSSMSLTLSTGAAHAAGADIVNPGFESGDFTGWSGTTANPTRTSVVSSYNGMTAPSGAYFAVVKAGCPDNVISESFSGLAGQTVGFYAFFDREDQVNNDNVTVNLDSAHSGRVTMFAQYASGGSTGWRHFQRTLTADDTYTFYVIANNNGAAGDRCTTGDSAIGFDMDTTAPTVSPSATTSDGAAYAPGTWTSQDVKVTFPCTDDSGVETPADDQSISTEGADQKASGTCVDSVGNRGSSTFDGIDIDKTAPTLRVPDGVTAEATDVRGGVVSYAASADDSLSGATLSCSQPSGSSFDHGRTRVQCQAVDAAGNSVQRSFVVHVLGLGAQSTALLMLLNGMDAPLAVMQPARAAQQAISDGHLELAVAKLRNATAAVKQARNDGKLSSAQAKRATSGIEMLISHTHR